MQRNTPKLIVMKWVSAYNHHNVDEIVSLYCDDITNIQFPWEKAIQGREAMRTTFIRTFQAFPDIHVEIENILENGEWVVLEWQFNGTMHGEFTGHAPTGSPFSFQGCEIFKIREELIQLQHGYWDKETLFRQLGIPHQK